MPMPEWLPTRRSRETQGNDTALWSKCPKCGEVLYRRDLAANLFVCTRCAYHFRMSAYDRIASIADGDFTEIGGDVVADDPLSWSDKKPYRAKLKADRERSGLTESVICGFATIGGFQVGLGVMDFNFRGGTMGQVTGERIALLLEEARRRGVPCVIFAASGGARMEEGMLALMQMAKTTAAVAAFMEAGNFFMVVLTDPTTGGVSASFAFQADVIVAESKAMIGFAGRRVIEQTIRQRLPDQFQTAEFLLDKGAIDMVIDRRQLKETLARLLEYAASAKRSDGSGRVILSDVSGANGVERREQ
jgi:acetyl-CoA carboxylase carboxyl transferase subunit beta